MMKSVNGHLSFFTYFAHNAGRSAKTLFMPVHCYYMKSVLTKWNYIHSPRSAKKISYWVGILRFRFTSKSNEIVLTIRQLSFQIFFYCENYSTILVPFALEDIQ